ncbi:MAG: hypothetical protein ABUS54_01745 [Actinomycetota bacterium]
MGRGVIGLGVLVGSTVGSFVPTLWGASSWGLQSVFFAFVGGVAGVLLAARYSES